MKLTVYATPDELPVSLADMKEYLVVEHDDHNDLLTRLLEAATARYDGRDGMLGRALVTQTWRATLVAFPYGPIELPLPPIQSIDEVTYLDTAGDEHELSEDDFRAYGLGSNDPVRLYPIEGASWPDTAELPGAVTVTFTTGYGAPDDVPAPILDAIKAHVAARYKGREDAEIPLAPAALSYREFAF